MGFVAVWPRVFTSSQGQEETLYLQGLDPESQNLKPNLRLGSSMHHTGRILLKRWTKKRDPVGSSGSGVWPRGRRPSEEIFPDYSLHLPHSTPPQLPSCCLLPLGVKMSPQFQILLPCIIKKNSFWTVRLACPHFLWHLDNFFLKKPANIGDHTTEWPGSLRKQVIWL